MTKAIKKMKFSRWFSVSTVVVTPFVSSVAYANQSSNQNAHLTVLNDFSTQPRQLAAYLKPNYDFIANEAKNSVPYNVFLQWIKRQDQITLTNRNVILNKISELALSLNLKLFLLQNYLEKIATFENYRAQARQKNSRLANSTNELFTQADFNYPSSFARYTLAQIEVFQNEPSWDINETKGHYDYISNQHFAKYLWSLKQNGHVIGWRDEDADSSWQADRMRIQFYDKSTNTSDYVDLITNSAQDTDGENEDYVFVGLAPSSKIIYPFGYTYNIGYTKTWERTVQIFNLPLDFHDMHLMALKNGLHIDSPYMASFHEYDEGEDNHYGNYLANINLLSYLVINRREGSKAMKNIVSEVINHIYRTLNRDEANFVDFDSNYLIAAGDAQSAYVYFQDDNGQSVHLHGASRVMEDYSVFADDITKYYWSNQQVLDANLRHLYDYVESTKPLLSYILDGTSALISSSTDQWIINLINKFSPSALKTKPELWTIDFVKNTTVASLTSFVISVVFGILNETFSSNWDEDIAGTLTSILIRSGVSTIASLPFSLIAVILGFGLPGQFIANLIVSAILSFLPAGNGYSVLSNIDDHGLNDWNYQWKENSLTMARIAERWSQGYQKGICWIIIDSWFGLPELTIETQDDNGGVISDSQYWLSPSDSFNYGNKISEPN